jgi:hypothetical protein
MTKVEIPESWIWPVLDLVIDLPKLAFTSLSVAIRRWLQGKKTIG